MNSSFFPVASLLSSSSPVSFSSSSSSSAASPGEDQRSIWLLGAHYGPITDTDTRWGEYSKFLKDFHSRLWITYRSGFEAIRPTSLTSDSGWGCMLRSGQMLLGETLVRHFLGRDWRLGYNRKHIVSQYTEVLSWFFDRMAASSPFSLHRIALLGKKYGKEVGEWFGPATISSVLQQLVHEFASLRLAVFVATDGVVYKDKLAEACYGVQDGELFSKDSEAEDKNWKSVLILIPLRLGLDTVNSIYDEAIKDCLKTRHCVGIAGGRPNSSLYFIGIEGDHLIYMDPHYTRPVVDFKPPEACGEEDFDTYHCNDVKRIHISKIDPSLLLGFYCKTKADVADFLQAFQVSKPGRTSIFSVDDEAPVYTDTVGMENFELGEDQNDFDMV